MGLGHDPRPLEFRREPAEARSVDRPEAELLKDALAARPDIRAAEMGVQAAAERVGIAGWEWLTVAAVGDANDRAGNKGLEGGPGVEVPLPVFNRSPGGVARAEAEVERAARHLAAVRHRVALEICSARLALIRAEEGVRATRERVVPALQESLRIAERAHQAGETSLAPVLESRRRLSEAALEEAEERAALERARAELERSVGRRLE
jgi:cobalt-zinc-cadmium efflux system outer membrane protein